MRKIYMIGIGGIGMSSLAQLYMTQGVKISGSDRDHSPTTDLLESKGVNIFFEQKAENVSDNIDTVVYSDAIPEENSERVRARELGIAEMSYFSALGDVAKGRDVVAVAGTHGKTTTTAMISKILNDLGKDPTAVIGSIVKDFQSNFLAGSSNLFVVEACEYRDHLLHFFPRILVINNLEWDHTDYFSSLEAMQNSFRKAISQIRSGGVLVTNPNDPNIAPLLVGVTCEVVDYTKEEVPELSMIGEFNRMNAKAAKSTVLSLFPDLSSEDINASLLDFKGTWRRFEEKGKTAKGALVFDDYAHHPTAVSQTIKAVKSKFPGKKIVVAFHPHLYSRTRDLMENFAKAFSNADEVVLAPIYPAREEPIVGVTSEVLAEKITANGVSAKAFVSLDAITEYFKSIDDSNTIFMTMGAGDIYKVGERVAPVII